MWNVFKIYKYSKNILTSRAGDLKKLPDYNGEERLEEVQALYREMIFPSNLTVYRRFVATDRGRQVLWGRGFNDELYVEDVVISIMKDKDYLSSLPADTLGAAFGSLTKRWSLDELYAKRFKQEEVGANAAATLAAPASGVIRVNISRHLFLSHDLWHCLFRYDTSPMGEGCIQAITAGQTGMFPMRYVAFIIALRECAMYKSWEPYHIYREAVQLGKETSRELALHSPLDFLETNIYEVRAKFNIGVPVKYAQWVAKHSDDFRMDNIHPEYVDEDWITASSVI